MSRRIGRGPLAPACLAALAIILAIGAVGAGSARASYYKMLLCAGGVGSGGYTTETNTAAPGKPDGIFAIEDHCAAGSSVPAGNSAYLRIAEDEQNGSAALDAFGRLSYTAPEGLQIAAAGGYTREPAQFNEGWRARYWLEGYDGSQQNILFQGTDAAEQSGPLYAPRTTTFAPHLWPYSYYSAYRRFNFELVCVRSAGCDRSGLNAADSNTLLLTLNDPSPPSVAIAAGALAAGQWVKGTQPLSWSTTEAGSGLRYERLEVDGSDRFVADDRALCDLGTNEAIGEYARSDVPCPTGGPFPHTFALDTSSLADGAHTASVCAEDFGQASGIDGSGGQSCESRTIRTDNSPPAAPLSLAVTTANPARYESQIRASWSLPADPGSPIAKVRYWFTDAAGNVVVAPREVTAQNPTGLPLIEGPAAAGEYRLDVALVDEVGFVGPAAVVAIPHDTVPPAAPQDLSVSPPSASRAARGFDVSWQNIVDAGSPIAAVHYELLGQDGSVAVAEKILPGADPEAIEHLATPKARGAYTLRLWLSDAEGNVGAPVEAPLAFDCVRSEVKGAVSLTATFGHDARNQLLVPFGSGADLAGRLLGGGEREVAGAPVCVFSRIITSHKRRFLGLALTDAHGAFSYPVAPGASRELEVENRPGARTVRSSATLVTRARPTLRLVSKAPVHNKTTAVFRGRLPGPDAGSVPIVLQVKDGKGWLVFRRISTRPDGSYTMRYKFIKTFTPVTYTMRTEVPRQRGSYPYHSGASAPIEVPVRPYYKGAAAARASESPPPRLRPRTRGSVGCPNARLPAAGRRC